MEIIENMKKFLKINHSKFHHPELVSALILAF